MLWVVVGLLLGVALVTVGVMMRRPSQGGRERWRQWKNFIQWRKRNKRRSSSWVMPTSAETLSATRFVDAGRTVPPVSEKSEGASQVSAKRSRLAQQVDDTLPVIDRDELKKNLQRLRHHAPRSQRHFVSSRADKQPSEPRLPIISADEVRTALHAVYHKKDEKNSATVPKKCQPASKAIRPLSLSTPRPVTVASLIPVNVQEAPQDAFTLPSRVAREHDHTLLTCWAGADHGTREVNSASDRVEFSLERALPLVVPSLARVAQCDAFPEDEVEEPALSFVPLPTMDPTTVSPDVCRLPSMPVYSSPAPAVVETGRLAPERVLNDTHVFQVQDTPSLPSLTLLHPTEASRVTCSEEALLDRGILIEEKLAEFKVKVSVVDAYAGPVITRFEVEPAVGVRGNQVVNLVKDLARALGLASIRVVETIPGKTCMGLELPNPVRQVIRLSAILSSSAFIDSSSKLTLALGQDISGEPIVMDLARAPHLLVAGTTGSGKSVGVNAMILSLLYKATPDDVRFIMIDPKMLELSVYNDIPHLLAPVVTDMKRAAHALNWCVGEMERRYRLMSALGVRNLVGYNEKIREAAAKGRSLPNPFSLTPETPEPLTLLPFIVVVVDEFADLMMVAGKKIEELIARLAQKARAAGIHLILATQRPSVDVITGLIKANIPTRIAFQVSSKIDSRTILDQMGAETLLGQGDMLYLPPGTGYPQRVHGAFVADEEVHRVVECLKHYGVPDYVEGLLSGEAELDDEANASRGAQGGESDPLYDEAVEIVLRTRKASISSVQRHLRIGYNRAARLIEEMEAAGIVSAMETNGNRTVLVPQREV